MVDSGPGLIRGVQVDEVLRLAARGLTTRESVDWRYIAPRAADHHLQHASTTIGVSPCAALALWAMPDGVVA
jgi:hypothetical protein